MWKTMSENRAGVAVMAHTADIASQSMPVSTTIFILEINSVLFLNKKCLQLYMNTTERKKHEEHGPSASI